MKFVFSVLLVSLAIAAAVPIPWKNCGKPTDVIKVDAADASIWPPVHGKPISLNFRGVIGVTVTEANYRAVIKLGPITILDHKGKLSDLDPDLLPFDQGAFNENVTIDVPKEIPAGLTIGARVELTTPAGASVLCVDVTIPFKSEPATDDNVNLLWPAVIPTISEDSSAFELPSVPIPWKNCGKPTDVIKVDAADASIWPPVHGKPISLNFRGVIGVTVTEANYRAVIKLGPLTILDHKGKLSDLDPELLPFDQGAFNENVTIDVPKEIPAGITIGARIELTTPAGAGVLCVDVTIPFKQPAPPSATFNDASPLPVPPYVDLLFRQVVEAFVALRK